MTRLNHGSSFVDGPKPAVAWATAAVPVTAQESAIAEELPPRVVV